MGIAEGCANVVPDANTSAAPTNLLITIVHGTWGRGIFPALRSRLPFKNHWWFDDQSQFASKLREGLSKRNIYARISAFNWSGANSIFARDRAGADLAVHLRDEASRAEGSRQVLIGHSHGGNVAIRALHHREINALAEAVFEKFGEGYRDWLKY